MLSVCLNIIIYGDSILLQMPVILVSQVICSVGTGLLTTNRDHDTDGGVLVGVGLGTGIKKAPHIAIQGEMERSVFHTFVHFVTAERRHSVTTMFS